MSAIVATIVTQNHSEDANPITSNGKLAKPNKSI